MIQLAIERLEYLCDTIPHLLAEIDELVFSAKPEPAKWSKKEIIGHLIDSATNNHHRFVRGQFEILPKIVYDQNEWNEFNFYQKIDGRQLISFWTIYNRQLLALIKNMPKENLGKGCVCSNDEYLTLDFLINDYVQHLEHHLKQVFDY